MADTCAVIRYANPSMEVGYAGSGLPSVADARLRMNDPTGDELVARRTALPANSPLSIAAAVDAATDRAWDDLCDAQDRDEAEDEAAFSAATDLIRDCDASELAKLMFEHLDGLGANDRLGLVDRLLATVRDADRDGLDLPEGVQMAWDELHDALCVAIASEGRP